MAEALLERSAQTASGGDEDEDEGGPRPLDALQLLDALHDLTGEGRDAILGWAWKRFCAEWARLYPAAARERERLERRREAEEFRKLAQAGAGAGMGR